MMPVMSVFRLGYVVLGLFGSMSDAPVDLRLNISACAYTELLQHHYIPADAQMAVIVACPGDTYVELIETKRSVEWFVEMLLGGIGRVSVAGALEFDIGDDGRLRECSIFRRNVVADALAIQALEGMLLELRESDTELLSMYMVAVAAKNEF